MTKQQLRKLQWLTNTIVRRRHDGRMSFSVSRTQSGHIIFCASNNDSELRWFETSALFIASIGLRGGLRASKYNTISI